VIFDARQSGLRAGRPFQGRPGAHAPGRPWSYAATEPRSERRLLRLFAGVTFALLLGIGCVPVGGGNGGITPPGVVSLDAPALEREVRDGAAEATVARLISEGFSGLESGDRGTARARAVEVETRYASTRGSSRALLLRAMTALQEGNSAEAESAATQYLQRVGPSDPQAARAHLVVAEARIDGRMGRGIESLFAVPQEAPSDVRSAALERGRSVAAEMEEPELRDLVEEAPEHRWLLPVFQVELGERRALMGDTEAGEAWAERALELDPSSTEADRARAVLEGDILGGSSLAGTLGVLLSPSGPPSLQQLSQQVQEGVEVALLAPGVRGGIRLVTEDDGGSPGRTAEAFGRLSGADPFAIVGLLTESALDVGVRSRTRSLPLISPTATLFGAPAPGIYSLAGVDPEAPRALARLVLSQGIRQVTLLHPRDPAEELEAEWFRQTYQAGGGTVVQTLTYSPGTTFFEETMRQITRRPPAGLVLLLPPGDVGVVTPQIAFYGVDDLPGIRIFGSASFSSESVLSTVPPRHTDGVFAVSPHVGAGYGPLWEVFIRDYEEHFQRTLRSPIPALGWDAARILLQGARLGGGTSPEQVLRGMERIRDFPGATGTFSVREGRVVRQFQPVRLENRIRIPLDP